MGFKGKLVPKKSRELEPKKNEGKEEMVPKRNWYQRIFVPKNIDTKEKWYQRKLIQKEK